jgi:hypothetical protein
LRVQPDHYDWLDQLVGGEHASQMVETPLFNPPYSQLSQAGVWETGQGSHVAEPEVERTTENVAEYATEFVFGFSSQTTNYEQENENVVPLRRTTREGRASSTYTPSSYDNWGRGRDHARRRRAIINCYLYCVW